MKNTLRKSIVSIAVSFCLMFGGIGLLNFGTISFKNKNASATQTEGGKFYFDQLSNGEKRFYNALVAMNTSGLLKSSSAYNLISNDVVTSSEVKAYANGNGSIKKEFQAAKDAFSLDYPEVFYVDFDALSLNLSVKENGEYIATIDADRKSNYFVSGFDSTNVQTAITLFDGETGISAYLPTDQNLTTIQKVNFVNDKLAEALEYGFSEEEKGCFVRTAYAATKDKLASAEGYAKAFKVCMDKLNIECVQVVGYHITESGTGFEFHSWNNVKLENGKWYAVDVTKNDVGSESSDEYLLAGENTMNERYVLNNVLSLNGKKFSAPTLSTIYQNKEIFVVEQVYENNALTIKATYNGKTKAELEAEDEPLYLVAYNFETYGGKPVTFGLLEETEANGVSTFVADGSVETVVVGVSRQTPTLSTYEEIINNFVDYQIVRNNLYESAVDAQKPNTAISFKSLSTNQVCENGNLNANETYEVTLTFSKNVKQYQTNTISVNVVDFEKEDISRFISIENVTFDDETPNVLKFNFKPSSAYAHRNHTYIFAVSNLTNADETILVEPKTAKAIVSAQVEEVVLTRISSYDRLLTDKIVEPTLIDNTPILELKNWNTAYIDDQISQITLISKTPADAQVQSMVAGAKTISSLADADIVAKDAYLLEINVCGSVQKLPKGNFVNIAFAYPEGYSQNSTGVRFVAYAYTEGLIGGIDFENPKILDLVATNYGLVADTDDVAYVMIAGIKSDKIQTSKTIYARAINDFGKVENMVDTYSSKLVSAVETDGSVKYAITPDDGYVVDYVLLNGKDVTSKVVNGEIELSEKDLAENNVLEVAFVSSVVKDAETQAKTTNLNKAFIEAQFKVEENKKSGEPEDNKTWLIVGIVAGSVVFAVVAAVVVFMVVKKKAHKK